MASTTSDKNGSGKKSTKKVKVKRKDVAEHEDDEVSENVDKKKHITDNEEVNEMEGTQSKPGLGYIRNSVALCVAIVCLLVAMRFYGPPEHEMKGDSDLVKDFGNGVDQLQLSFTNQTERFWKTLKNRGLAHLKNNNPSQPLVFLLAAPPPAHEWVDCLAIKLAEKLDPRHKRNLAKIDGADEKRYPGDKVKKTMDDYLKEKFLDDHRVAVIHRLELLPFPSPQLFYSYCDDQNAPYKHVAIIFTVHLPEEPSLSLSPKEAEATVEKYLSKQVWLRDDVDAVAALLSRIANTVVLMNGESSDSLKAYCS